MSQRYAERLEALHTAPVSVPTVGDPMLVTLRAAMHTNFVALLEHEVECRRDKNIEALRTMLRAVFQLRALVKIAEDDFDQKTIKKAGKRLRKLSRCLADVHELDVMMRDILHYGAALSHRRTIATIVAHLDAQRLLAKAQLIEYLDSKKYRKFLKRFQAFLLAPADEVLDLTPIDDPTAPSEVRHLLPVVLHQQLAKIRAYDTFMDASDNEVFVAMRNDVWLFRYTLTCYESVLGRSATDYTKDLLKLEDMLVQVTEMSQTLQRLIHLPRINMDSDQLVALKNYRKDLRSRREKLYNKLPVVWEDFNLRRTQENLSQSILVLL